MVVLVYWRMSYFCVTVEKLCLHRVLSCGLRKERKHGKVKCSRFSELGVGARGECCIGNTTIYLLTGRH